MGMFLRIVGVMGVLSSFAGAMSGKTTYAESSIICGLCLIVMGVGEIVTILAGMSSMVKGSSGQPAPAQSRTTSLNYVAPVKSR